MDNEYLSRAMDAFGDKPVAEIYKDRVRAALEGHQARVNKQTEPKQPGHTKFTTQYCVDHARRLGWRLLDRERYDFRTHRHHDLMLGADAMFESPGGLVLVQGAGRGERAEHWRRFDRLGGLARAHKLGVRFIYLEFVRGDKSPVKEEWWA